ncbi:hypothetical protein [Thermococcus indicus]|nr:hypothetical protein [Thermococcus indicus]
MAVIVFYQILTINNDNELEKVIVFVEIILISISFTLTQQALYKTVLGRDPWTHGALIAQILKNYNIPTYEQIKTPYVWIPNFHLWISTLMLIGNVTYKWASYISVGMTTLIIEILVIYKLGKYVFNNGKVALVSILFLAISDNVLDKTGKTIFPNSIGIVIVLLIFYMFLKKSGSIKFKILVGIFIISLAFMHTVSYMFMIIQATFILVLAILLRDKIHLSSLVFYYAFIWVIAILVWGFISLHYLTVFIILAERLVQGLNIQGYESSLMVPFKFVLFSRLGMLVYFGISGIGLLWYYFNTRFKQFDMIKSNVVISSAFFVGFGSLTFLIWPEIAHRFWYYGEILGSLFVAYLLHEIWMSPKKLRRIIVLVVVLLLSWLMFVASISNDDNPLIKTYSIRTGWFDSEIQAGLFLLHNMGDYAVASDWDYIAELNNLMWTFRDSLPSNPPKYGDIGWVINAKFPKSLSEVFESDGYLFVFRKDLTQDRLFELGPRWGKRQYMPLGRDVSNVLKEGYLTKDTIYTTKSVIIWY